MDVDKDELFMIYSSLDPMIRLVDLETLKRKQEILDLTEGGDHYRASGICSTKFSGDSKEIVAGSKAGEIIVFDLVANRVNTRVRDAHDDEINSVCFANRQMSDILFTGGDDCMVKVWDRRAFGTSGSNRPAGVFVGHAEGVTNIASKGDGIYAASNGKD
mmetsp:Transcript_45638/g.62008  ORF Transcript_45638/g.62008 Transcript_45638/m.62008 type:complete len:160 (+) Transcript_45638:729-1208(+)|eukprot:CAMPEP_0176381658 /NCGR_PEP_ID=MMETSP0126-20121128/32059_1 /TAXON_ID=141414 ORGANISM="Strombidinopsis acuminatum, Strain SPMC142" /NCGR_SAMPLE_ID=MMETSP0126 /ASSEMBLY_ACC=CAM_ASM_000229 /LENGTH=159 /DNA_ID=CAMNT_0017745617 /DNA_START=724 /DNA_END=1203 /DNA_ORIENTATION=+